MTQPISRRRFISQSTKTTIAISAAAMAGSGFLAGCDSPTAMGGSSTFVGFEQTALPYAFSDLEPVIDTMTMDIHYSKHAAAYASNLNEAAKAENVDKSKPVESLFTNISKYSVKLRNNAGGHYNHELFWRCMKPNGGGQPAEPLLAAISQSFGSFEAFQTQFADAAKNRFGSGWAWLYADGDKKLQISSTPNQDNPLMDVSESKGTPLLGLDVWEHAYYLNYQNKRPDYISAWWKVVNWEFVQQRFAVLG